MITNRLEWENIRSVDSATLNSTAFVNLGLPLQYPSYICKIINNSTVLVTISNDGINAKDVVPSGSFFLYDEGKMGLNAYSPSLPAGTQISISNVSGVAGTGSIYLVTQYIIQG